MKSEAVSIHITRTLNEEAGPTVSASENINLKKLKPLYQKVGLQMKWLNTQANF